MRRLCQIVKNAEETVVYIKVGERLSASVTEERMLAGKVPKSYYEGVAGRQRRTNRVTYRRMRRTHAVRR